MKFKFIWESYILSGNPTPSLNSNFSANCSLLVRTWNIISILPIICRVSGRVAAPSTQKNMRMDHSVDHRDRFINTKIMATLFYTSVITFGNEHNNFNYTTNNQRYLYLEWNNCTLNTSIIDYFTLMPNIHVAESFSIGKSYKVIC